MAIQWKPNEVNALIAEMKKDLHRVPVHERINWGSEYYEEADEGMKWLDKQFEMIEADDEFVTIAQRFPREDWAANVRQKTEQNKNTVRTKQLKIKDRTKKTLADKNKGEKSVTTRIKKKNVTSRTKKKRDIMYLAH